MGDTKLEEKARFIYSKHKEAFDYIFDNRPLPDELLKPLDELIRANPSLSIDLPSPRRVRFAPVEWKQYKELNSCSPTKWTKSERGLLFELQAHRASPRININLMLGPGDESFRKFIFSEATKDPALFMGMTKPLGRETSTIYLRELLSDSVAQNLDEEERATEIMTSWGSFVSHDLKSLIMKIEQFVMTYRQKSMPTSEASGR